MTKGRHIKSMSASDGSPRVGVKTFARSFGSAIRLPTAPARHRRVIELPSPFALRLIVGLAGFVPPALTLLGIAAIDYLFWLYIRARRADRAAAQRGARFVGRNREREAVSARMYTG